MKSNQPVPIKEILATTMPGIVSKKEDGIPRDQIGQAWLTTVGRRASEHSYPSSFKRGVIVVNVDSPVWIYQLNINKQRIQKQLTRLLGQEKEVTIRLRAGEQCGGVSSS